MQQPFKITFSLDTIHPHTFMHYYDLFESLESGVSFSEQVLGEFSQDFSNLLLQAFVDNKKLTIDEIYELIKENLIPTIESSLEQNLRKTNLALHEKEFILTDFERYMTLLYPNIFPDLEVIKSRFIKQLNRMKMDEDKQRIKLASFDNIRLLIKESQVSTDLDKGEFLIIDPFYYGSSAVIELVVMFLLKKKLLQRIEDEATKP